MGFFSVPPDGFICTYSILTFLISFWSASLGHGASLWCLVSSVISCWVKRFAAILASSSAMNSLALCRFSTSSADHSTAAYLASRTPATVCSISVAFSVAWMIHSSHASDISISSTSGVGALSIDASMGDGATARMLGVLAAVTSFSVLLTGGSLEIGGLVREVLGVSAGVGRRCLGLLSLDLALSSSAIIVLPAATASAISFRVFAVVLHCSAK